MFFVRQEDWRMWFFLTEFFPLTECTELTENDSLCLSLPFGLFLRQNDIKRYFSFFDIMLLLLLCKILTIETDLSGFEFFVLIFVFLLGFSCFFLFVFSCFGEPAVVVFWCKDNTFLQVFKVFYAFFDCWMYVEICCFS